MSRERLLGERLLGECLLGERLLGERLCGERLCGEPLFGERLFGELPGRPWKALQADTRLPAPFLFELHCCSEVNTIVVA